ncbi:MAG: ribonuclease HII [Pseudomonadota bacterium]
MPPDEKLEDDARAALLRDGRAAPRVAGVDEAGRGPWAGPVGAGAVVLAPGAAPEGLDDSKKLSAAKREALADALREIAAQGGAELSVAFASVEEIDGVGLGRAADLAMLRALEGLGAPPDFALIDGRRLPRPMPCAGAAVIRGDGRSASIAAASILAKTERDRVMEALAREHPEYGWETNRGYGTPAHLAGLRRWGVTQHHRRSFRPIHKMLVEESAIKC